MIYYATQQTLERYKLNTPENFQSETGDIVRMIANKERGNRLYEWGCKLFYFDRLAGRAFRKQIDDISHRY